MAHQPISRRAILVGGGVLGVAVIGGAVVVPRLTDDDEGSDATPPSPGTPAEAIAGIGAAYLAGAPDEEADEAFLRSALPTLTATTPEAVVDQMGTLADPILDDFAAERTARVDGWILAVSEARAAALVHLLAS